MIAALGEIFDGSPHLIYSRLPNVACAECWPVDWLAGPRSDYALLNPIIACTGEANPSGPRQPFACSQHPVACNMRADHIHSQL